MKTIVLLSCCLAVALGAPRKPGAVYSPTVNADTRPAAHNRHAEAGVHYQGDISLSGGLAESGNRNAHTNTSYRWPNAKVCYYLDTTDQDVIDNVNMAIKDYHAYSCVRFHTRTSADSDCIRIFRGNGCYSLLGRQGGIQDLSLGVGCTDQKGVAIHELLHALGFTHEQSRDDRDDYVKVLWDNLEPGDQTRNQYAKQSLGFSTFGMPYDYGSVMHYEWYYFQKDPSLAAMEPTDPNVPKEKLGQRAGFSELDLKKLNKVYCDKTQITPGTLLQSVDVNSFASNFVSSVNEIRRSMGASDMMKTEWDNDLAKQASQLATQCTERAEYTKDSNGQHIVQISHSSMYTDIAKVVQSMADYYTGPFEALRTGSTKCCIMLGFTQYCTSPTCLEQFNIVVNGPTKKLGCGLSKCQGLKNAPQRTSNADYYVGVCIFDGQFNAMRPFIKGSPCSACSESTCDNGLCAKVGSHLCEDDNSDRCQATIDANPSFTKKEVCDHMKVVWGWKCDKTCGYCSTAGGSGPIPTSTTTTSTTTVSTTTTTTTTTTAPPRPGPSGGGSGGSGTCEDDPNSHCALNIAQNGGESKKTQTCALLKQLGLKCNKSCGTCPGAGNGTGSGATCTDNPQHLCAENVKGWGDNAKMMCQQFKIFGLQCDKTCGFCV